MKKKISIHLMTVVCVAALSAAMFVGCAAANVTQNEEQQQNRAYMSQVNEIVLEANGNLDAFVDAVSSGDIVSIKATANSALKTLSKLSSLEAPDALEDIHDDYVTGSEKLSEALSQYVDLYGNASSAGSPSVISEETLAQIQSLYEEGVASLKAGDEAAAEL